MAAEAPRSYGDISEGTEKALRAQLDIGQARQVLITGDGAIDPTFSQTVILTKGSAAAITIAAPAAADNGTTITIIGNSDFAHVVTFTGSTLNDGTTGNSITWTSAAFKGSSVIVQAYGARWLVVANNLGTIV